MDELTKLGEARETTWTPDFQVLRGRFAVGKRGTQYLQSQVSLSSLDHYFVTVADIPGSEHWGFEALFQRDIDENRVKRELVQRYLLSDAKEFTFFPPLTIALLPFDPSRKVLRDTLEAPETNELGDWIHESYSCIELKLLKSGDAGFVRWNPEEVKAVAVDGQHRLAALAHPSVLQKPGIDLKAKQIPVTFLIPEPNRELVSQVREIFVDINKSAKAVSGNRLILLDDRDPFKVFTRQLLRDDFVVDFDEGIPYWHVDWKADDPRPTGHQLTTMTVLYDAVRQVFEEDPRKLDDLLSLNDKLEAHRLTKVEWDSIEEETVLLSDEQMDIARSAFDERMKPFMLTVYRGLHTFQEFSKILADAVNDPEQGTAVREYFLTSPKHRERKKEELRDRSIDVSKVIDMPVEKLDAMRKESLVLTSVGQRGLFRTRRHLENLYGSKAPEDLASAYVEELNQLDDAGFFGRGLRITGRKVWEGIVLRSGSVSPSKESVKKFSTLVYLALRARHETDLSWLENKRSGAAPVLNAYQKIFEAEDEDGERSEAELKREASEFLRKVLEEVQTYGEAPEGTSTAS